MVGGRGVDIMQGEEEKKDQEDMVLVVVVGE